MPNILATSSSARAACTLKRGSICRNRNCRMLFTSLDEGRFRILGEMGCSYWCSHRYSMSTFMLSLMKPFSRIGRGSVIPRPPTPPNALDCLLRMPPIEDRRLMGWAAAIECLFDRGLEALAASPPIERRAPMERRVFAPLFVIGPSVVRRIFPTMRGKI